MKRTRKLWVAAVAMITAVLMIGCNGLTGVTVENEVKKADTVELTGVITNYSEFVSEDSGNARTILPGAATLSEYIWWLVYNEVGSTTKTFVKVGGPATLPDGSTPTSTAVGKYGTTSAATDPATIDVTKVENGKFVIPLKSERYQLSLYAVPNTAGTDIAYYSSSDNNAKLAKDAVIKGTSYVDLTNDSGTANFTMSTNNLEGSANVSFDVVLDKWGKRPLGKTIIEIRDYLTNEEVKTADVTPATTKLEVVNTDSTPPSGSNGWKQGTSSDYGTDSYYTTYGTCTTSGSNVSVASKKLKAGIYNFCVTFYKETAGTTKLFTWSDVMIVLPNRDITAAIYISDAQPKAPEAPLAFMASYDSSSLNPVENDYEVYFEWTDMSKVEDYYVMELVNVDVNPEGDAALYAGLDGTSFANGNLNDSTWNTYKTAMTGKYECIEFDPSKNPVMNYSYYYDTGVKPTDGGFWANNTKVTLTLPMGRRYLARIRAVNTAGESPWVYVDLAEFGTADSDADHHHDIRVAYSAASDEAHKHKPAKANFDSDTINIYKIVYHLNGGRYSTDGTTFKTDDLIVYKIQDKITLTTPARATTKLEYWDGFHVWLDGADSPMKSKSLDFGGSLKKDATASDATDADGTGAKDDALLGTLSLKFDTNGDLKYKHEGTEKDANFGTGSLQMLMTTEYHVKGTKDIAAFKYWVADPTYDPEIEDIIAETKKYDISTGYDGFQNVELWAKYQPINVPVPDVTGYVTYDDPTQYNIYSQWIKMDQNDEKDSHTDYDDLDNTAKAPCATLSKGDGNFVRFQLTVPAAKYATAAEYAGSLADKELYRKTEVYVKDTEVLSPAEYSKLADTTGYEKKDYVYGMPAGKMYDSVKAIAYTSDGYEAGWACDLDVTTLTLGVAKDFDKDINISKWKKGQTYRIVFTAKKGKYSYTTSVNLTITD